MRIVALGGLGEIGRNMMVIEDAGRRLLIDAGVLFPDADQPGVDVILPDMSYLADKWDTVDALVLTHGHEDHIGAVPYVLRARPHLPIYGTELTLALVEKKTREHRQVPTLHAVADRQRLHIAGFDVEFVAVNHSIPDAVAVAVHTSAGTIVHTGDFRADQFPLDGRITDVATLARLGADGVALFAVDSTNADVRGFALSEKDLLPAIEAAFRRASGRVVVSTFASHIHRIQHIMDVAAATGRRVAFYGRSMVTNTAIAAEHGYLRIPPGLVIDAAVADTLPGEQVAMICTGSQGEPNAALSRMAAGTGTVDLGPEDLVLLASSTIPGNETSIFTMIDRLEARGVTVVHRGNATVHTSGHACAGELAWVYNLVKPAAVLPVHGEWRHLRANAAIAARTGVDPGRIPVVGNGAVLQLDPGGAVTQVDQIRVGHVYVEGMTQVDAGTVSDRVTLAEDGIVTVVMVVDETSGTVTGSPQVLTSGVNCDEVQRAKVVDALRVALETRAGGATVPTRRELDAVVVAVVRRWARQTWRRTPIVTPVVVTI